MPYLFPLVLAWCNYCVNKYFRGYIPRDEFSTEQGHLSNADSKSTELSWMGFELMTTGFQGYSSLPNDLPCSRAQIAGLQILGRDLKCNVTSLKTR